LDSADGLAKGGESGIVVVPGRPEESELIRAINYDSLEMPPDGKLGDQEIGILTRWVKLGAPWPKHSSGGPARRISPQDRSHWALQPLARPRVPVVADNGWCRNEIDRFIYARLAREELRPAPPADRRTLIRRLSLGLTGLPPSGDEVTAFVEGAAPAAAELLIDSLLASPRYGEQWGRHWLDLVRYAESDGHHQDLYRPQAWRYRDYVIESFNSDKPYDEFVREQLAGDELAPDDPAAVTATGYLRHWIYEGNQRNVDQVRQIVLDDVTEVTGEVFLALSFGCARCHDHKYDPILQEDYYRLQAFFAAMIPRDDVIAATPAERDRYLAAQRDWETETAEILGQIKALESPIRQDLFDYTFKLFPQHIKDLCRKSAGEQTPLERAIQVFAERHLAYEQRDTAVRGKLSERQRKEWDELNGRLSRSAVERPAPPLPMTVSDLGPEAPGIRLAGHSQPLDPRFPAVFGDPLPDVRPPPRAPHSTGRRSALAHWIASPDNPLTARVIVNRIWQYHFGQGLVPTPSDFGRLGSPPSHPELLDWLAQRFIEEGWRFKPIHRLILNSATYRQSAIWSGSESAQRTDPENRWLGRMNIRRLTAEQIRDVVLVATGELERTAGGPSAELSRPRRSVYVKVFRNDPYELLQMMDAPDGFNSTAVRDVSTSPTQALLFLNGEWMLERAAILSRDLAARRGSHDEVVTQLYERLFARRPDELERAAAAEFLAGPRSPAAGGSATDAATDQQRLADLCHVLFNTNELIYVD
jgi:hypothetical protein